MWPVELCISACGRWVVEINIYRALSLNVSFYQVFVPGFGPVLGENLSLLFRNFSTIDPSLWRSWSLQWGGCEKRGGSARRRNEGGLRIKRGLSEAVGTWKQTNKQKERAGMAAQNGKLKKKARSKWKKIRGKHLAKTQKEKYCSPRINSAKKKYKTIQ